jgi:tRNA(Ile)-lysidine synthase
MIKLLNRVPNSVVIACSGGPDSMAALSFLNNGRRNVRVVYFDHGTEHGSEAGRLVESYCKENKIFCISHKIVGSPDKGESLEAWWRDKRYKILNSINDTVVTGHNLNDVAEWWIFTALRGNPRLMPYQTGNVIKPFLLTEKSDLEAWCARNDVPYIVDPTNSGDRFARSKIRKNIMPEALDVAPGFLSTIRKKIKDRSQDPEPKASLRKIIQVL